MSKTVGLYHELVSSALQRLIDNDSLLITEDVDEQTLTFRLGMYLQELMPSVDVDCEYNRVGEDGETKRGNNGAVRYPDIIVHRRGKEKNFIIIEAKKKASDEDRNDDLEKLHQMTDKTGKYKYEVGYFINFVSGDKGCSYKQSNPKSADGYKDIFEIKIEVRPS